VSRETRARAARRRVRKRRLEGWVGFGIVGRWRVWTGTGALCGALRWEVRGVRGV